MNFRFHGGIIKRSDGRNLLEVKSYQSGEKLYNARLDETHDYSRRKDVLHNEIMAPKNAPQWVYNRQKLWNVAENTEKRKDAQLAREIQISLDGRLSLEENKKLIYGFAQKHFIDKGMIADISFHKKPDTKDSSSTNNLHVHILLTMRKLEPAKEGIGMVFGKKDRKWNSDVTYNEWREDWRVQYNKAREAHNLPPASNLSHEDRKLKLVPIKTEGPENTRKARQAKKKREKIVELNKQRREHNSKQFLKAVAQTNAVFSEEQISNGIQILKAGGSTTDILTARNTTDINPNYIKQDTTEEIKALKETGQVLPLKDKQGKLVGYTTPDALNNEQNIIQRAFNIARKTQKKLFWSFNKAAKAANIDKQPITNRAKAIFNRLVMTNHSQLTLLQGIKRTSNKDTFAPIQNAHKSAGYRVIGITPTMEEAKHRKEDNIYEESYGVDAIWKAYTRKKKSRRKYINIGKIDEKSVIISEESERLSLAQTEHLLKISEETGAKLIMLNDKPHKPDFDHGNIFTEMEKKVGALYFSPVQKDQKPIKTAASAHIPDYPSPFKNIEDTLKYIKENSMPQYEEEETNSNFDHEPN